MDELERDMAALLTPERAAFVRKTRVDDGGSWRWVARQCSHEWGTDWDSNQLYGMALCTAAARHFGEDPGREPWN